MRVRALFESVEQGKVVPIDLMNKEISKYEFKYISEVFDTFLYLEEKENLNNQELLEKIKQKLLEKRILKSPLLTESEKTVILNSISGSEILNEGIKELAQKAKDFVQLSIKEVKKVFSTFKAAMGQFGAELLAFLKGFKTIDLKEIWGMIKDKQFIRLAKYVGNWLLQRLSDGAVLYREAHKALEVGVFQNLATTKPVEALRMVLKNNIQDKLDDMLTPKNSPELMKYMGQKYPGKKVTEVLDDKIVLKYIFKNQSVISALSKLGFRVAIGAFLAYVAWETWNTMVFKGDLIYDYDFSQAWNAIKGNFDISGWFLSDDGGFETLLWLIAGYLGMGSIAPSDSRMTIGLAVVVTVIMIWKNKNARTWIKIKSSKIAKKIVKLYEDSKKRVVDASKKLTSALKNDITHLAEKMKKFGFLKPSPIKV